MLLKLVIVIVVIFILYKFLYEVICLGKNEVWICGFRYIMIIICIGINGKLIVSLYNNIYIVVDIVVNV